MIDLEFVNAFQTAIRDHFVTALSIVEVSTKGAHDYVSTVDLSMQAKIIEILNIRYPDFSVLGEESKIISESLQQESSIWIVDPLDGTSNFLFGINCFSVSIAALVKGGVEAAIVLDLNSDDCFWAVKGGGHLTTEKD